LRPAKADATHSVAIGLSSECPSADLFLTLETRGASSCCGAARPPPTDNTGLARSAGKRTDFTAASDGQAYALSTRLYRRQYVPMFLSALRSTADRDTNCEHNSRTSLIYQCFLVLDSPCAMALLNGFIATVAPEKLASRGA